MNDNIESMKFIEESCKRHGLPAPVMYEPFETAIIKVAALIERLELLLSELLRKSP